MIRIDAEQGEGGGQVLRTALALSAIRGVPVCLRGIRAGRKAPGLRAHHLAAVTALAQICRAEVVGAALGSPELTFVPGPVRAGEYHFDIGMAGSTTLALQALLVPLALASGPSRVTLTGGTHVPSSPPADYLREVFFPSLEAIGIRARVEVEQWGFSPSGGGRVAMEVDGGAALTPLTLVCRSGTAAILGVSGVAGHPRDVAKRQQAQAVQRLEEAGLSAMIELHEMPALDQGNFLFLVERAGCGRAGFSSLGGCDAEVDRVVGAAVDALLEHVRSGAACDPHLADQLVVALALAAGTSRLTTSRVTPHLLTLVSVVQQMLGCPAQVRGEVGSPGSLTIEGVGTERPRLPGDHHVSGRAGDETSRILSRETTPSAAIVRKARASDGPAIQRLLAHFAARGELLHRTLNEVYQHLRDFVVCEADGEIVGVCALWLYWEDLAEVRSLAVHEHYGGRGLGKALVGACLEEAAALGIRRVFALTYRPGFFERLGFEALDKRELPQKIWKDCIRCAKFTCCDEVALIRRIEPPGREVDPGARRRDA